MSDATLSDSTTHEPPNLPSTPPQLTGKALRMQRIQEALDEKARKAAASAYRLQLIQAALEANANASSTPAQLRPKALDDTAQNRRLNLFPPPSQFNINLKRPNPDSISGSSVDALDEPPHKKTRLSPQLLVPSDAEHAPNAASVRPPAPACKPDLVACPPISRRTVTGMYSVLLISSIANLPRPQKALNGHPRRLRLSAL